MRRWKTRLCRRTAALCMAVVMCVSLAAPAAAAASSTMQPYLDKIVSWGVMRGDINGNLNTEKTITRAEFVTMINRAFGFSRTGTMPFKDVPASAWYAEDVGIAYTEGYINGTTATTFSPYSSVTREQAAVILARILMLQPQVGENTDFTDSRQLGNWSRGLVAAAADYHIVNGYADGSFRPKNAITRGAAAILIVNAVGNPIQKAGEYSLGNTWGNVTITASGVTLRNTVVGGNLYISEGVDLGQVTLENVTVLGEIVVSGGGASEGGDDSIILRNVSAKKLVLDNMKNQLVSVRVEGDGTIPETYVRTNAYLSDRTSDGYGLTSITLDGQEEGLSLTLAGNIKEVVAAAPKAKVNLASGQAQTITVDEKSTGSTLNIASGAQAGTVNLDTGAAVTGSGDIAHLNVNAAGSTVTMLPDQITIRPGITANISGEVMDAQTAAESSADPRLSAGYPKITNLAPTSATAQFAANKKGTVYWAVTAVTDGSVSTDDLINPSAYNSKILKRGTVSLTASGTVASANITGLTADGSYYLSAVLVDAREQHSPLKVISFTTPDNTKPDFASGYPYMSKITSTSGQVTVMPTKTCRLYYAVLPKGASAPTASDFKANAVTGNLGFGVLDVTKNTTYSFNVNSVPLEELKSYDVYLWLSDVDNGQSSSVRKLSFTTVDGTPPVFNTDPTVNSVKETSVGLYANLNEDGTLYWVVVEHGETYPKPIQGAGAVDLASDEAKLQVMAGMNALKSGKVTMTANKDVSFNISGLEAEKSYDLYYVAQDKAGNYSAAVQMVEIHTLDNSAPTVTQEFTKYNGTDTSAPLPDSDVRLVFSEAVQTADTHTALSDLYEKVNQSVGQGQAETDARAAMALALSKAITLYQVPAGRQPVKVEGYTGSDKTGDDWTIDYRYAAITVEEGKTVVTFPAGKGINLKSGATYYFEIQADTIADTSTAFNVMGRTPLDRFTTVFAQVNLSALNENSITYTDSTSESPVSVPADVSWRLDPVSTEKVDGSMDWDMLIWSDTSVEFQLFRRQVQGSTAGDWQLLGTGDITVPDGVSGYRGVSLTRDFLQHGSSNPDFQPLNGLKEDTAYEYAISFTKVAGIADPAPRKGVWSQRVNLKVYVAAGSDNDLGFLTADLTEENWTDALSNGVTNIGLPADFSLRKQFTDNTAPAFIGGYPEFTAGDSTVEMRLMLDRPGTVYYVVAPMGTVSTVSKDGTTNYGTRDNWQTLPKSGAQDQPAPPQLGSPDYLNIVNASSNYRNDRIKYGVVQCGASVEVELVSGLDKTTPYTVYFVLQGTSQTYSRVMAYQFSTQDVGKPRITLNNYSPSVNFQTDSTADLNYVLIASNEIPSVLKESFDSYVSDDKAAEWKNFQDSSGKTYTVLTALCTTYSNGYSVFDEFAKSDEESNIRSTVANLISGTATMGVTIAAQGSKSLTQGNSYRQEQNFTSSMTGGTLYYCLASAESPLGSEMSFAGISGVYIPDKTPPELQSVNTAAAPDGANLYSGTVTFVFNEPVYQLVTQNGVDQLPKAVWQTQYTATGTAVRLKDIMGVSVSKDKFSYPNDIKAPASTLALDFKQIPLGTTIVLFDSSYICDANSNSTRQNLTFRLEKSSIGLVDGGVAFVQVK